MMKQFSSIINKFYTCLSTLKSISEWVSSSFGSDGNKTAGTKRKRVAKKPDKSRRETTDYQTHKKQQPSPLTTGILVPYSNICSVGQ